MLTYVRITASIGLICPEYSHGYQESGENMNRADLQLAGAVVLAVFFLVMVVLTVVYLRRRRAVLQRNRHADSVPVSEEHAESKGYWINKDDIDAGADAPSLRYYHHFYSIDECIHDLIVEMYDCGFVRTEEIFVAAYGEAALTPDSFIYMTDLDGDIEAARAALPPVSEKSQKIIYELWVSYVDELMNAVEIHTSESNKKIIQDALMVYGRKKTSILLRSPE